jgi:hypothetical protein
MSGTAIDLVTVARDLPERHKALAHQILQLRDAHSIRTDLKLAADFFESLRQISDIANASEAGATAENCALALFYSGIILYARATDTSSEHRRSFDFRSKFDEDEKRSHRLLCDLRNDAIAHFGPGGSYAGAAWQKEGVFVPTDGSQVMTASRRLVLHPTLILEADRQIIRALLLAERDVTERNSAVAAALNAATDSDPDFVQFCHDRTVSLDDFFGHPAAAIEALSGPRIGSRRGKVHHPNN